MMFQYVVSDYIIYKNKHGGDLFWMKQDHAGHIFGVDSAQMIEKLEQYNEQLEVYALIDACVNQVILNFK